MEIRLPAQHRMICALLIWASFDCTLAPRSLASPQSEVTFGTGERLWLRLDNTISSKTAQAGDRVEAELLTPRTAKVTRVLGTVGAVRAANKPQRIPARLTLIFTQIVFTDGRAVSMEGSFALDGWGMQSYSWKAATFAAAVGMGVLGALIGGAANGAKGAGVGAAVGASLVGISMASIPTTSWKDVLIKMGRPFPVELKHDVRLPIVP